MSGADIAGREITCADDARQAAIDWQHTFGDESMSWGELLDWQAYFASLVERFPELRDEFTENGIC